MSRNGWQCGPRCLKVCALITAVFIIAFFENIDLAAQPKQSTAKGHRTEQVNRNYPPIQHVLAQKWKSKESPSRRNQTEPQASFWSFPRKNLLVVVGLLLVVGLMMLGNRLRWGERHKATGRMSTSQEELVAVRLRLG